MLNHMVKEITNLGKLVKCKKNEVSLDTVSQNPSTAEYTNFELAKY